MTTNGSSCIFSIRAGAGFALVPVMAWFACDAATPVQDRQVTVDRAVAVDLANKLDPGSTTDTARADVSATHDVGPAPDLAPPPTAAECVQKLLAPAAVATLKLDYDQFHPTMNRSCSGTQHQQMTGIQKIVFLGDSITVGTPPTPAAQFYTNQLVASLTAKFGQVVVQNCARWGATTVDLLGAMQEIAACFPSGVEPQKTLVVMTVGSNNLQDWALARPSVSDAMAMADVAAGQLRDAIIWLKDPKHFPGGSYVLFANAYEYTDLTGDLDSCFLAQFFDLKGNLLYIFPAVVYLEEQFMKVAVETGSDLIFLFEHFCGHGFHNTDPSSPCYRGPGTEQWFDVSCVHPNPTGHGEIAKLFFDIVSQ